MDIALKTSLEAAFHSLQGLRGALESASEGDLLAIVESLTDRGVGTLRAEVENAARLGALLVDVSRQRRSGDGAWVAVLRAWRLTENRSMEVSNEIARPCESLAEARQAAKELAIKHADFIEANARTELIVCTKSEFDEGIC